MKIDDSILNVQVQKGVVMFCVLNLMFER